MILKKISLWIYIILFFTIFWININSVSEYMFLETDENVTLNKEFMYFIVTSPQKIMFNGISFFLPLIYITRKDWLSETVLIRIQAKLNNKTILYAVIIAGTYTALTYVSIVLISLLHSINISINLMPFILKSLILYVLIYMLYLIFYTLFINHTIAILVLFFIELCYSSIYISLDWVGLDVDFMMGFWDYPITMVGTIIVAIIFQVIYTKQKDYL